MDFYMTKTTAGLALDQKLPNSDVTLKFTKAMSGAGKVEQTSLESLIGVSEPMQTLELKDLIYPALSENTTLTIPVLLSNADLETGYELFQVGVYAQDPDAGEILYLIAQITQDAGEPIPSENDAPGFSIDFNLAINVANTDKVEVVLNEAGKLTVEQGDARYAKKTDLEALREEFDSLDISSQLEPYAKKADVYTKMESDAAYAQKTDVYTKTESDTAYAKKTDVYAKTETYAKTEVYSKTETYSKAEVDQKLSEAGGGGVIVAASAPPGDASMLWIDTTSGGVSKYWNGSAWVATAAVWG